MNKKKFIAAGAAIGIAASLVATAPANAEPVATYAAVGSDTLQDVLNGLANGSNITGGVVRSTAGDSPLGSFDATGSNLVQTKPTGPRFTRPNGSGAGVSALSRSIDGAPYAGTVITGQVDLARSSSGAGSLANPTGPLAYLPFGRDALAYAHTGGANAAFDNITQAQLKSLFECTATTIGGVTAVPVIPQLNSGTRNDFLSKIGVTGSTLGSCVLVGQEHDTTFLADGSTAFPANGVTPMSAAQWVSQNTGAGIDRRGAGVELGSPIGVAAVTGTGTAAVPNSAYYADTTWGRDVYVVVENSRITSGSANFDAKLANLVSTQASKLGNNTATLPSQAGSLKRKYGFLAPSTTVPTRANLRP